MRYWITFAGHVAVIIMAAVAAVELVGEPGARLVLDRPDDDGVATFRDEEKP